MTDIIVEVRGGCVVAIHSRTDNVKVDVIDWDNHVEEEDWKNSKNYKLQSELPEMITVY